MKFSEIVVMVLALLGGLVFLFFIGTALMMTVLSRTHAETGGISYNVVWAISSRLFTTILLVALALIVAATVALVLRSKRHST
jgi:biotin transporter BioY